MDAGWFSILFAMFSWRRQRERSPAAAPRHWMNLVGTTPESQDLGGEGCGYPIELQENL